MTIIYTWLGIRDCRLGYVPRLSHPTYLAAYGRQYEYEQCMGREGNGQQ